MFEEGSALVDVLLWVVYLLLGVVSGLIIWSSIHSLLCHQKTVEPTRGVPARAIAWGAVALLAITLALTFLLGSSKPMLINNQWLKDVFWLKLADMFIYTTMIMLVIAAIGVVVGSSGIFRKVKK